VLAEATSNGAELLRVLDTLELGELSVDGDYGLLDLVLGLGELGSLGLHVIESRLEGLQVGSGIAELALQGLLDLEILDLLLLLEQNLHFALGLLNVEQHALHLAVILLNNLAHLEHPSLLVVHLAITHEDVLLDGRQSNLELRVSSMTVHASSKTTNGAASRAASSTAMGLVNTTTCGSRSPR